MPADSNVPAVSRIYPVSCLLWLWLCSEPQRFFSSRTHFKLPVCGTSTGASEVVPDRRITYFHRQRVAGRTLSLHPDVGGLYFFTKLSG